MNTKHPSQCQLKAHNRLSDFSGLHSQILPDLRRFYQHLDVCCPESRRDFAFESELIAFFIKISYRPPISHFEDLGGDECEKKETLLQMLLNSMMKEA